MRTAEGTTNDLWFITALHEIQMHYLSVRSSICPSVKCVHCDKTEERSKALRAKIDRKLKISLQRGHFDSKFQVEGVAPTNYFCTES